MKIELRAISEADFPTLFEYQRDPVAVAMSSASTRERDAFVAHWLSILSNPDVMARAIVCDGLLAGNLSSFDRLGKREVGYWLGREFWGRGIATAALRLYLDEETVRPLWARVAPQNAASLRVLAKCGFVVTGRERFPLTPDDPVEDFVLNLP